MQESRYVKDCQENKDAEIECNQRSWTHINPGDSDLWSCVALEAVSADKVLPDSQAQEMKLLLHWIIKQTAEAESAQAKIERFELEFCLSESALAKPWLWKAKQPGHI